ncbi:MAG: GrpB family protein [Candidatus Acidiferrales bacterium]
MPPDKRDRDGTRALSEEELRACTIGELEPLVGAIQIVDADPGWPNLFAREAKRIRAALDARALRIEHVGSTSVPQLRAKPVIDMLLLVEDSAKEANYASALEGASYVLRIREPDWYEHRMFKGPDTDVNLHVFSPGCPEVERMLLFRDWLRNNPADRDLYARTKLQLAQQEWKYVQNYADAKTAVIQDILSRVGSRSSRTA